MYTITRLRAARNAWNWTVNFGRRGRLYHKRFYGGWSSTWARVLVIGD